MLPFHIITEGKKSLYTDPEIYKIKLKETEDKLVIPTYFYKVRDFLDTKCEYNPISPQGMMIFGALSSSYVLLNNINLIKFP